MKLLTIPKTSLTSSTWSGGTTTEFYISPPTSTYIDRNFDVRISSATIDSECSTFTSLPMLNRHIMTLTDSISLSIKETNTHIDLPPFTPFSFDGAHEVISNGACMDFNFMVRKGLVSQMHFLRKSCTLLPNDARYIYVPPLSTFGPQVKDTSAKLEWTDLEEDTLYIIEEADRKPLKLRITNPKVGVIYMTLGNANTSVSTS